MTDVFQVCANHLVQPGASISYKDKEKKALLWTALDFADDDNPHIENFCCRFKTPEIASQFMDMYEQAKGLSGASDGATNDTTDKSPGGATTDASAEKPPSLSALFAAKPGSWECDTCLVRNPDDVTKCPACLTPRPGFESAAQEEKVAENGISMSAGGGFKFGSTGGATAQFGAVSFSSTPVFGSTGGATAQFGAVSFSSTPVKGGSEQTPATLSYGAPFVAGGPAAGKQTDSSSQSSGAPFVAGGPAAGKQTDSSSHSSGATFVAGGPAAGKQTDSSSQSSGTVTEVQMPTGMLFGKETTSTNKASDQVVPATSGFTGKFGQLGIVTTETATSSSSPVSSFTFGMPSKSVATAPFSFDTAKFGDKAPGVNQAVTERPAEKETAPTKTVIGGFSFAPSSVPQAIPVTTAVPASVSAKATDKPNPFATFSFASAKTEFVSTSSDAPSMKPFCGFGGFGAKTPTVSDGSTSLAESSGATPSFGAVASAPIFGTAGTSEMTSTPSLFGGLASAPIFANVTSSNEVTNVSTSSLFGGVASAPIFANVTSSNEVTNVSTSSLFANVTSSNEVTNVSTSSLFAGVASAPIFSNASTTETDTDTSLFSGSTPAPIFGSAKTAVPADSSNGLMFGNSASTMTFASVAAMGESPEAFSKKSESATAFQMGKGRLFESVSSPSDPHNTSDGHEDYEPTAEFEPVISLPHIVDLKTGEEDEDKIFGERARLYRLDCDTKTQWKERGVGVIKILRHKHTNKYRIVMRREQVLKLCANHNLTPDMTLRPLATSDRAWCWFAHDFAEDDGGGEGELEHLAVKFKTPEIAGRFKEVFEDSVKLCLNVSVQVSDVPDSTTKSSDATVSCGNLAGNLADMFRLKGGEWECDVCLVKNLASTAQCAACQIPRPAPEMSSSSQPASSPSKSIGMTKLADLLNAEEPTVSEGKGQSLAELFRADAGEWECAMCLVRNKAGSSTCAACETPKPGSKQDAVVPSAPVNTMKTSSAGGFTFNMGTPFNFASDTTKSTSNGAPASGFSFSQFVSSSTGTFSFGETSSKPLFGMPNTEPANQASSPSQPKLGLTPNTQGNQPLDLSRSPGQSTELYEEEDTNVYFEPVVQLPDDFQVETGEEQEEVLYAHRAKLYRFADGEWKERGLGEVKLLRHGSTQRMRVLMRREQILKICLNHLVTPELELKPMNGANGCAWVWHADDFADGSSKHEQFAIRFKTAVDAEEFKTVFDGGKEGGEEESEREGGEDELPGVSLKTLLIEGDKGG